MLRGRVCSVTQLSTKSVDQCRLLLDQELGLLPRSRYFLDQCVQLAMSSRRYLFFGGQFLRQGAQAVEPVSSGGYVYRQRYR